MPAVSLTYPDVSGRKATYEGLVLGMNPFRYWPLDDVAGTAARELASGNDGVYTNTPTLGQSGNIARVLGGSRAAQFDSASVEYITPATGAVWWDSTGGMTAACWCYYDGDFTGADAYPEIICCRSDQATAFEIAISNKTNYNGVLLGSNANFLTRETPSSFPGTNFQNTWRHVALVFDGIDRTAAGSYTVYVDGVVRAHEAAGVFAGAANSNRIARNSTGAVQYFHGKLQHVAIFQSELTPAQINTLYQAGRYGQ